MKKQLCDYKEAAILLGVEPKDIKPLILAGKIKAIDISLNPAPNKFNVQHVRIFQKSIDSYLRNS